MVMKEVVALRRETKKYIDQADAKTVKMIHAMLEAEQENDWWDDLSTDAKKSIEKGLKEADEGKVISHEEAMKKFRKWRLK
jgi:predicted transcriptional regulator